MSTLLPPPHSLRARPSTASAITLPGVWRGCELGHLPTATQPTGWEALDRALPGGGWPSRSLTELLAPQPASLEWRLLGPALQQIAAQGRQIVAIAPPRHPYLPGLQQAGLDERRLIWIQADPSAERLWATEQLIKSNACGAIIAWLPQARPEQLRRLQVGAQSCDAPVFLCHPESARHESSAAPLRVLASLGLDWELRLQILKRRGPILAEAMALPSVPGRLACIITPRLRQPSRFFRPKVPAHAMGRPALVAQPRWGAAVQ